MLNCVVIFNVTLFVLLPDKFDLEVCSVNRINYTTQSYGPLTYTFLSITRQCPICMKFWIDASVLNI